MASSQRSYSFAGSSGIFRSATENIRAHGPINMVDTTLPLEEAEAQDAEGTSTPRRTYSRKIRDGYTDYKYRRYQESRYVDKNGALSPTSSQRPELLARSSTQRYSTASMPKLQDVDEHQVTEIPSNLPPASNVTTKTSTNAEQPRRGRLARGTKKVKGLLHRRRYLGVEEGDTETDVLYENERGSFLCGIPRFSSKSLLNFDPQAWLNSELRPSPVTPSTAQVPDPSWQWEWKSWYVDMSDDVDEDGWQYSFMFQNRFAWHGTHPWFHSFVRRRKWVRKRVRKNAMAPLRRSELGDPMKAAHRLNADYFTIHPARPTSITASTVQSSSNNRLSYEPEDDDGDEEDIEDIGALMKKLKLAKVDRDKINLVLQFMDQGGEDTYYLAEEMHHILSMFIFQHSRQRLLELMNRKIIAASRHREEHKSRNEPEYDNEKRRIDNLERARKAADKELQQLEYWSDIKGNVRKGLSATAAEESQGWDHGWQGLDDSGPGDASLPVDDSKDVLKQDDTIKTETSQEAAPSILPDNGKRKEKQ